MVDITLLAFLVILAIAIIYLRSLFAAVMLTGIFSLVAACLYISMDAVDHEGHPLHLNPGALVIYWCWLLKEIFISNIYVCRLILDPAMPISPTVIALRSSQSSDLARVIFANSITLTPGTVTIDVDGDITEVHAITEEAATSLLQGSMDNKVTALESRSEE